MYALCFADDERHILSNHGHLKLIKPLDLAFVGKEKAERLLVEAQVMAKKVFGRTQELLGVLNKELVFTTIFLIAVISIVRIFILFIDISFLSGGDKSMCVSAFTILLNANETTFLKNPPHATPVACGLH